MRHFAFIALLFVSACTFAQAPTVTAKPDDVKSIDSIIAALYDVISGPPATKHDWDRFRSLFVKDARLSAISTRRKPIRFDSFGFEDYIKLDGPFIEKSGFSEHEIARRTEQFDNMAHVFQYLRVADQGQRSEKPFARGINSIQLYNDGDRWWVGFDLLAG